MKQGRIRQPKHSQQTHCKTLSNCAHGSDPRWGWKATDCKCALDVLLAGVSSKRATEQPRHLNRKETQTNRRNTLRGLSLYRFSKHLLWFRCSGKGKHLNPAARQNPTAKTLTTNTLQDFRRLYPRFRSMAGLPLVGRGLFLGIDAFYAEFDLKGESIYTPAHGIVLALRAVHSPLPSPGGLLHRIAASSASGKRTVFLPLSLQARLDGRSARLKRRGLCAPCGLCIPHCPRRAGPCTG